MWFSIQSFVTFHNSAKLIVQIRYRKFMFTFTYSKPKSCYQNKHRYCFKNVELWLH